MQSSEQNSNRYVTNATASSLAFYAMTFLNNQGYSPSVIKQMREKFSMENLHNAKFTIDELKNSFSSQSAYFLNLYVYMNENDRFENFAKTLESQKRFKEIFRNYNDFIHLRGFYNRKIFHKFHNCEQIKKDYDEDNQFHPNTGVFGINEKKNQKFYVIPEDYLLKLGMKLCTNCYNFDLTGSTSSSLDLEKLFAEEYKNK